MTMQRMWYVRRIGIAVAVSVVFSVVMNLIFCMCCNCGCFAGWSVAISRQLLKSIVRVSAASKVEVFRRARAKPRDSSLIPVTIYSPCFYFVLFK